MQKKAVQQKEIGKYIISDPRICHGEPTFRGTRKLVHDCIEMVAHGLTIDELASRAGLPREAIVEALHLSSSVPISCAPRAQAGLVSLLLGNGRSRRVDQCG